MYNPYFYQDYRFPQHGHQGHMQGGGLGNQHVGSHSGLGNQQLGGHGGLGNQHLGNQNLHHGEVGMNNYHGGGHNHNNINNDTFVGGFMGGAPVLGGALIGSALTLPFAYLAGKNSYPQYPPYPAYPAAPGYPVGQYGPQQTPYNNQQMVPQQGYYDPNQQMIPQQGTYVPNQQMAPQQGTYVPNQLPMQQQGGYPMLGQQGTLPTEQYMSPTIPNLVKD